MIHDFLSEPLTGADLLVAALAAVVYLSLLGLIVWAALRRGGRA